jgi:hypothetical protein
MNRNTMLCVDVKTLLLYDNFLSLGKAYQGVLTKDGEDHLRFVETMQPNAPKRNPRVFNGQFITITRKDDGSPRPNFKAMPVGMSVDNYAIAVCNELLQGLIGFVEE